MRGLLELLRATGQEEWLEFRHILDFQKQRVPDEIWIPNVARDRWIIITADRGKRGTARQKGGHLPTLCREHEITHVILGPSVHRKQQFDKIRAVFDVWDDLLQTAQADPGSRFVITMGQKHARLEQRDAQQGSPKDR